VNNVAVLSPNTWTTVKVPLDSRQRRVLLKCGATEGDACSRIDLRVDGKIVLKTSIGEAGLVSSAHRVVRLPSSTGLIAVSVEKYSIDSDNNWTAEETYSGKLYK